MQVDMPPPQAQQASSTDLPNNALPAAASDPIRVAGHNTQYEQLVLLVALLLLVAVLLLAAGRSAAGRTAGARTRRCCCWSHRCWCSLLVAPLVLAAGGTAAARCWSHCCCCSPLVVLLLLLLAALLNVQLEGLDVVPALYGLEVELVHLVHVRRAEPVRPPLPRERLRPRLH